MPQAIGRYDQEIAFGEHSVEVEVRAWEFGATFEVDVPGWMRGADVLEEAVRVLTERLRAEAGEAAPMSMPMHDADGNALFHRDVENRGAEWLRNCVVAIRIVRAAPSCGSASGPASASVAVT